MIYTCHACDVHVTCVFSFLPSPDLSPPMPEGMLRLQGGANTNMGRLEVYRFGHWGTVCSYQFDARDGDVACRELGYSGVDSIIDRE